MEKYKKILALLLVLTLALVFMCTCAPEKVPVFNPESEIPTTEEPTTKIKEVDSKVKKEVGKKVRKKRTKKRAVNLIEDKKELSEELEEYVEVVNKEDVKVILSELSKKSNINIVFDSSVKGLVPLYVVNLPIKTALKMISYSIGCKYKYIEDGNYYVMGRATYEAAGFDKLSITKSIKVSTDAKIIVDQLSTHYETYVNYSGEQITITAPPSILERIERDILLIDKEKPQIEVIVNFVTVRHVKGSDVGIKYDGISLASLGKGLITGGTSFSLGLVSSLNAWFKLNKYSSEAESLTEIRVLVEEGESGELKVVEEHMFLILSGGGSSYNYYQLESKDVGVKLSVIPTITRDNKIRLTLNSEVSEIVGIEKSNGESLPIISRESSKSVFKIKEGESLVFSRLSRKEKKKKFEGIPGLIKIPIINSKSKSEKEVEIVAFVTARIIR